ncbi:hypothetical protein Cni_G10921 [Canna indica]|uniref:S-adenosyl-L-methionine-dependent methyltransferase n=1 Tax=Canna indica TaxID=4628 RepID=A0AAQ3K5F3_9LILI|nr:hypothetical protein Cni_G10921 [Canna indica]
MSWSRENAANAYLDTLKLRAQGSGRRNEALKSVEPECNEFISAMAAGMGAKLIVEVSPEPSQSTIALAAAARQTGGRLVCILPEQASTPVASSTKEAMEESGLNDMVEFKVGDPHQLLPEYENIDFSLVNCKSDSYRDILKLLDVNPRRAMVVANHLGGGREGLRGDVRGVKKGAQVRSLKRAIGEGMEVTMIGRMDEGTERKRRGGVGKRRSQDLSKSKWVKSIDEESGEEHIFRVPMSL